MILSSCNNLSSDSMVKVKVSCDYHSSENCFVEDMVEYKNVANKQQYKCRVCIEHDNQGAEYFDRTCMAVIDTKEKAYLLGWIASIQHTKQELEDGTVVMKISKNELDSIELLQKQKIMCSWWFEITLRANNIYFIIRSTQIWNDICRHMNSISLLPTEELKWDFIRGFFERSGKIEFNPPMCTMPFNDTVHEFVTIPFKREFNDVLYYETNAIDFLGKIYQKSTSCRLERQFHRYIHLLKPLSTCYVYKTSPNAILPCKNKVSDVGYDLSVIREEKRFLNNIILYDTGIKIRVEHGMYAEVVPRSSLSKSGYMLANSIGIIDPSYNGRILIALIKVDPTAPEIQLPFRCCQLIFRKQIHCEMIEVAEDFENTFRGEGGFGSTGLR